MYRGFISKKVEVKGLLSNSFEEKLLKIWALQAFIRLNDEQYIESKGIEILDTSQSTYLKLLHPHKYADSMEVEKKSREEYKIDLSLLKERMLLGKEASKVREDISK